MYTRSIFISLYRLTVGTGFTWTVVVFRPLSLRSDQFFNKSFFDPVSKLSVSHAILCLIINVTSAYRLNFIIKQNSAENLLKSCFFLFIFTKTFSGVTVPRQSFRILSWKAFTPYSKPKVRLV